MENMNSNERVNEPIQKDLQTLEKIIDYYKTDEVFCKISWDIAR